MKENKKELKIRCPVCDGEFKPEEITIDGWCIGCELDAKYCDYDCYEDCEEE